MPALDVFQSMWAMEFQRPDNFQWSLEEKLQKIAAVNYKGVSFDLPYHSLDMVQAALPLLKEYDLELVFNLFVDSTETYRQLVNSIQALNHPTRFVGIVGQLDLRQPGKVVDQVGQWLEIGREMGMPTHVETHRNCITNDLMFTRELLHKHPELKVVADLSHVLVNQEWYLPLHDTANELMTELLDRAEAFHGRVASREQMQIGVSFPQHQPWFELFQSWWLQGFASWIQRHGLESNDRCVFLCELGPPVYAITGPNGEELSDRWEDALVIRTAVEKLWQQALESAQPSV